MGKDLGVVLALLVRVDGGIILQQRDNNPDIVNPGQISAFGGSIEEGEDPIDAISREISEETNLNVSKDRYIFFKKYQKTELAHGEEKEVYSFIVKGVDDKNLEIYEGKSFVILKDQNRLSKINVTLLLGEMITDYYKDVK